MIENIVNGIITYDAMVGHPTIVFTRYILLEWIHRNQNDPKNYGELFFMVRDDIQDMNLTNALQGLMFLFTDIVSMVSADITELLKNKANNILPFLIMRLLGQRYY